MVDKKINCNFNFFNFYIILFKKNCTEIQNTHQNPIKFLAADNFLSDAGINPKKRNNWNRSEWNLHILEAGQNCLVI